MFSKTSRGVSANIPDDLLNYTQVIKKIKKEVREFSKGIWKHLKCWEKGGRPAAIHL